MLHDLERIIVPDLDLEAFDHLSRLPRLQYLWLMSPEPPRYPPSPKDLPCFPSLRIFECESMEAAPNLLERTGKSLVQFELSSRSWRVTPTKQMFRELYAALASSCTHTLLKNITIDKPWRKPIEPTQLELYVLSGEDLKSLLCFQNLVHVSLAHSVAVDLDDAVTLDMARAWLRIEVLAFPSGESLHRITPRMTVEGVSAFAEHCPLLRRLSILFDATSVPKPKLTLWRKKHRRASQRKLTHLDVAYSAIGGNKKEWSRVADFLRSIFPALYRIEASKPDSSADHQVSAVYKAWMKVSAKFS
ncbi:hypothetical protein FB45DRAFT_1030577 [Roridomyces roridus]|uniref:Uncharacterized protein n=1 Tax=Roridomyces roridus TaxID=1738132 RepID=A0AAD7BLD2_9AGAR|nr:hypothetical protein FB45DRAFT_1030577 [Roridomyces roridus]